MAASSRVNRTLDADTARAITEIFTEVIIAPDATEEAIAIIAGRKNLRLLLAGGLPDPRATGLTAKTVAGGLLVQSRDNAVVDDMTLKVVTRRAPDRRRDCAISNSRSASPSTSSPTPSSMQRISPPSASAPGR